MAEKTKGDKFLLYIPKGKEKEFEFYKKVVRELGLTVNERIWSMISSDMEIVMTVIKTMTKVKENEQ